MSTVSLRRADVPGVLVAILVVNVVGSAPAALGGPGTAWFESLAKPGVYPPSWLFGVVWPVLFTLLGVALYLVWRTESADRPLALGLFAAQMTANVAWTPAFFLAQNLTLALGIIAVLLVLAAATAVTFGRIDRRSGLLFVPYLGWIAFAAVLNYQFIAVN